MRFNIRVVMNDDTEYYLKDLTEKETRETLANAYKDIANLKEEVRFTNDFKVNALDLQYFCIE